MMACMVTSPVIVWRQGHDTDDSADPIVRKTAAEKRAMAAVVLDHEEADEQARRGRRQQQANPMAVGKDSPHQSPDDEERNCCDRQFEDAARAVGLAITCEQPRQCAGFRPALNHIKTAFEHVHLRRARQRSVYNGSDTALPMCHVDWSAGEVSSALEALFRCVGRLLGGSDPVVALAGAVLSWPAKAKAMTGFMLSTIDVGIRIVVPRSLVVSLMMFMARSCRAAGWPA